MHLKNTKQYNFSSFTLYILFLSLLSLLLVKVYTPNSYNKVSNFNAYIAFITHAITLFFTVKIYKNATESDRKILQWLIWINIGLFLNDLVFFILVYMHGYGLEFLNSSFLLCLLDYLTTFIWVFSSIAFLSKMLLMNTLSARKLLKTLFPFFFLNCVIVYLFLSSIQYAWPILSWQYLIRMPLIATYFIILDLALLGLIYSTQKGLSFFFAGLTVAISGDLFIIYSSISHTDTLLVYGELLWVLGLLFILSGTLTIAKTNPYTIKQWYNETNSLQVKLTFWSFSASIAVFLFFFIIAFSFSIINKGMFLGLPLFIVLYSIVIVVLSVFIGARFAAPFKQIENNVRALMFEVDKSKMDDNFSTQEFIFLQKFIVEAFEFKEAKNIAQKRLTNLAAQVAHDIRSPLSALNTCLKHLPQVPENQRILIHNAANRINDIANSLLQQYTSEDNSTLRKS